MPERFFRQPESLSEESQSQISNNTNISSDADSGIQHLGELRQLGFENSASQNTSDSQDFLFKEKLGKISSSEEEIFYSTEETLSKFEESKLNGDKTCSLKKKWLKSVDPATLNIIQVNGILIFSSI